MCRKEARQVGQVGVGHFKHRGDARCRQNLHLEDRYLETEETTTSMMPGFIRFHALHDLVTSIMIVLEGPWLGVLVMVRAHQCRQNTAVGNN